MFCCTVFMRTRLCSMLVAALISIVVCRVVSGGDDCGRSFASMCVLSVG